MTRPRKTLQAWISEAITDTDKEGLCTLLSLVHTVGGQGAYKEIHSKKVVPDMNIKDIAEMFREKAEDFAGGFPGTTQHFALLAFYGGKGEHQAVYPFYVSAPLDLLGGTEPPTPSGEKQQSMRHTETMFGIMCRQSMSLFEAQNRMIAMLSEHNTRLARESGDAFEITREMMLHQITNQQEFELKRLQYARSTEERKKFLQLAPALVNSLTGKEVFPQATEDTALVESILEALTPEMIGSLAPHLPPTMLGPLMDRANRYMEKKQAEAKRRAELPAGSPESELGGGSSNENG